MSESKEQARPSDVQGMYAQINDSGVHRCTVTMSHVSLTTYHETNIFAFDEKKVAKAFNRIAMKAGTQIDRSRYEQDFADLLALVSKTNKTTMCLISGDKVHTYVAKTIVQSEEDKYLEMSPYRREWWMDNPHIAPVVESIQEYLPDFRPWRVLADPYISILSKTSSLT